MFRNVYYEYLDDVIVSYFLLIFYNMMIDVIIYFDIFLFCSYLFMNLMIYCDVIINF